VTIRSFQRARSAANKEKRAAAFVEAARAVAAENGVASVTLTAIADRVGVHHSALRRYFSSHQELLPRVAAERWQHWSASVQDSLAAQAPASPATVADVLAGTLDADPLFCDLLTNVPVHLEHEVELESVLEFKTISHAAITEMAHALETALPGLSRDGALDLITATTALAATLWKVAHPGEALAHAYADNPAVAPVWALEFRRTLTRLLTATCTGLVEPFVTRTAAPPK
jgi:AcrR family transcriptional regulator